MEEERKNNLQHYGTVNQVRHIPQVQIMSSIGSFDYLIKKISINFLGHYNSGNL